MVIDSKFLVPTMDIDLGLVLGDSNCIQRKMVNNLVRLKINLDQTDEVLFVK